MKVIVIGLGSMGKRRIRLLKKISADIEIIGVDSNMERVEFVKKEYNKLLYNGNRIVPSILIEEQKDYQKNNLRYFKNIFIKP